jgi:DNA-binding transcriptional regulator YdaS (Cro superfamily)
VMEHPRVKQLIEDLRAWCAVSYGRHSEVARALAVSPAIVSAWIKGERQPNAHHAFAILDFLEAEKRKATRKRKAG